MASDIDAYVGSMTPQQGALFAKVYAECGLEADKLPYSPELSRLIETYNAHDVAARHPLTERIAYALAIRFRKAGVMPKTRHVEPSLLSVTG